MITAPMAGRSLRLTSVASAALRLRGTALHVLGTALPTGAIVLSALTFAGYAMGLVRDRIFARTFGAGPELDAYNAAFVLPELALDVLVAGGLVAPFVPLFTGLREESAAEARAFGRTILTLAVVVMGAVSATLFVFAPETVSIIAPGFREGQRELYVGLFRVMCVTPVIFAASIVLGEVLVAERRFLAVGLAPVMYNGGIVAGTLILGERLGIFAAAVGAVIGAVLHLAIRVAGVSRTTFRPRPSLALRTRGIGTFLRLMVPKMVSHPIEPLTFLYYTALASTLGPGSVSSVSFARNFASVPVSLIGAAFSIVAFPALSVAASTGDRGAFRRVLGTNLATIAVLTVGAAVGLVVLGGLVIRVFLGGEAFDEEDVARTTTLLAVFAIAIPLESLTHLLSRAIYATRNTILPTIASMAGFAAIVVAADDLAPDVGLAAVPASFAVGMAVKVAILSAALLPRVAAIGKQPATAGTDAVPGPVARRWGRGVLVLPRLRRSTLALSGLALVALAVGLVHATSEALSGASLQVAPVVTPWARVAAPAVVASPAASTRPAEAAASSGTGRSPGPSAATGASPTPKPGPFAMDLYEKADYVGEFRDIWCLPAAMQTAMNVMDEGADRTSATQSRLFSLARSLAPAPDGAAEPEGWAQGLTELGYGNFEVAVQPSIKAAIHLAAKQIRATNRPAGLMVWRGAHSWVMSGFTSTADPAATDRFTVTAVRIEDVWYPRLSSIWGRSRPPDALVPVGVLDEDYLPWHRPRGTYPDKEGRFVLVIPVE